MCPHALVNRIEMAPGSASDPDSEARRVERAWLTRCASGGPWVVLRSLVLLYHSDRLKRLAVVLPKS